MKCFSVFLAIALLLCSSGLAGAVSPAGQAQPGGNVHPLLLNLAGAQPQQMTAIIVQKTTEDASVEALAARLGGRVTKDLSIIHAFAAELPAGAVPELARAAGVRWVSPDAPVVNAGFAGGPNPAGTTTTKFTTWATKIGTTVANGYTNPDNALGAAGPNGVYATGARVKGAFAGFAAEYTPGTIVNRVEAVLGLYVSGALASTENIKVTPYVNGVAGSTATISASTLNTYTGSARAGKVAVTLVSKVAWKWSGLPVVEVVIDQSSLAATHSVFLDGVGLCVTVTTGTTDTSTPFLSASSLPEATINTAVLTNVYNKVIRADQVWNEGPAYQQGSGVTVAEADSGILGTWPFENRVLGFLNFNNAEHQATDQYGHGSFVAGVMADSGVVSNGQYIGVAPKVNLFNLRVSDDFGGSTESDVVSALQWVYNNRTTQNIRAINLSLNSSVYQPYHNSPLDAACEVLWFNGVVVIVSAGNNGSATLYPPANDPFVITVGATDDKNTVALTDDTVAGFSAYGRDDNGAAKPDLVAPGTNIIGYLPDNTKLTISVEHPANRVDSNYFRMSGTSMAAPMVTGAVALLLQGEPNLNPDQVKFRLMATANKSWTGYDPAKAGAGYLDVYAAVHGMTTATANTGKPASQMLWTGSTPVTWGSVQWSSVQWSSVQWSSVQWSSVQWSSVQWSSDYWGD